MAAGRPEQIEEERRVLGVAMTRAKLHLHLIQPLRFFRAKIPQRDHLDFLLSAKQDAAAAKRFLAKALGGENHPTPRVINTDKHAAYPPAIVQLKDEGVLEENCQH
jgi:ATP-dependent exoDNAse (exonuclease V) beta subunit